MTKKQERKSQRWAESCAPEGFAVPEPCSTAPFRAETRMGLFLDWGLLGTGPGALGAFPTGFLQSMGERATVVSFQAPRGPPGRVVGSRQEEVGRDAGFRWSPGLLTCMEEQIKDVQGRTT